MLSEQGKWVLIHQNEVAGVFDTYADALQHGYETFQLAPFLVKQISAIEQIQHITRELILD